MERQHEEESLSTRLSAMVTDVANKKGKHELLSVENARLLKQLGSLPQSDSLAMSLALAQECDALRNRLLDLARKEIKRGAKIRKFYAGKEVPETSPLFSYLDGDEKMAKKKQLGSKTGSAGALLKLLGKKNTAGHSKSHSSTSSRGSFHKSITNIAELDPEAVARHWIGILKTEARALMTGGEEEKEEADRGEGRASSSSSSGGAGAGGGASVMAGAAAAAGSSSFSTAPTTSSRRSSRKSMRRSSSFKGNLASSIKAELAANPSYAIELANKLVQPVERRRSTSLLEEQKQRFSRKLGAAAGSLGGGDSLSTRSSTLSASVSSRRSSRKSSLRSSRSRGSTTDSTRAERRRSSYNSLNLQKLMLRKGDKFAHIRALRASDVVAYTFDAPDAEDNIVEKYDDNGVLQIRSATLDKLVERLTHERHADTVRGCTSRLW